jgi:regulator of cell morphogenesis and NO signaling
MKNTSSATVGACVAEDYRAASVFQKYGIDFCCKGGTTIAKACADRNIDPDQLQAELLQATEQKQSEAIQFSQWPADLLADYIEKKHHRYVVQSIPVIMQFLEKLCRVHGGRHPELFKVEEAFAASAADLQQHMKKEEQILFPFIRQMVQRRDQGLPPVQPPFGSVDNPVRMMMQEHDTEGERFRQIARWTDNYQAPVDGCTTYRVAYAMLQEFEADLHLHIHLENNILFPKALGMEKGVQVL